MKHSSCLRQNLTGTIKLTLLLRIHDFHRQHKCSKICATHDFRDHFVIILYLKKGLFYQKCLHNLTLKYM